MSDLRFKAPPKKVIKHSKLDLQLQNILNSTKSPYAESETRFGRIIFQDILHKIKTYGQLSVNSSAFENMLNSLYFTLELKKTNTDIIRFALQNNGNSNNKFGIIIRPRDVKQFFYGDLLVILGCINFNDHKYTITFDGNYKFAEFLRYLRIKRNPIYGYIMYAQKHPNRTLLND